MGDLFDRLSADARDRLRRAPLPDWTAPMLAMLTDRRFSDPDWLFERKFDGERCLVFGRVSGVTLMSRNGNVVSGAYPELVAALELARKADDFVADGEIVAFTGRRTSFQRLQARIHLRGAEQIARSGVAVHLYLFDLLHVDGMDTTGLALRDRKALLRRAFRFGGALRFSAHRVGEGERFYADACRKGWEGLIAKDGDSSYVHKRSRAWLKFKCSSGQELVVGGFTDPQGSRVGFGALLLGHYRGRRLVYAGKVGTGFDTKTLRELRERLGRLERQTSPFATERTARRDVGWSRVHWVEPRLVAQVGFSEWTSDGRLRHPRFEGLRTDKAATDVVRERAGR